MPSYLAYTTLDAVRTIITEQIPEGIALEYKGSSVLAQRDRNVICKTVSAMANSIGGIFVIGIEAKDDVPVRIDAGVPAPSKRDWIYQTISGGTFPAVEGVNIHELPTGSGSIYVIDAPASSSAPHQSNDHKYYKRRGSHSEVMEHYEIEDVRNRPKRARMPLRAELHTQNILAYLRLSNSHDTDTITQLRCKIEANFSFQRDSLGLLGERGLLSVLPGTELYFMIGSLIEILQEPEPTVTFKFSYLFHEATVAQSVTFHLADWNRTGIMKSPIEAALETLGEKVDKVSAQLEKLFGVAETLTTAVDGTGLRVSQRTLRLLKDLPQKFDPREFDVDGYMIVADIARDDAVALYRLFHYFGAAGTKGKENYEKIGLDVRERFEKHFKVKHD